MMMCVIVVFFKLEIVHHVTDISKDVSISHELKDLVMFAIVKLLLPDKIISKILTVTW